MDGVPGTWMADARPRASNAATFVVGITGGSAAGKTTVAHRLAAMLAPFDAAVIGVDRYFRDRSALSREECLRLNYDEPAALDFDRLADDLAGLRAGRAVRLPRYDYVTHVAALEPAPTRPAAVTIVEGILLLVPPRVPPLLDLTVFVEADRAERLRRRVARDTRERGLSAAHVAWQFHATVEPGFDRYIAPTRAAADVVLDWNEASPGELALLAVRVLGALAA